MLQQCTIKAPNGALGLNLSRAPWDPYPWVSGVQAESNAHLGGVCIGDTLLQLNGADVLGMRISELATRLRDHWLTGADCVTMMMWRQQPTSLAATDDPTEAAHAVQHGINQQSLQKFATCLQHIAQLLECPVCCDVIKPPGWQCCNGHVLCNNCRNRSVKCPVCRVPLGPRGRCLLSDKLFTLLAENFPCDGVKTNVVTDVVSEGNSKHKGANKCTNEYHNQPKMALPKSNSGKKCRKTSRQMLETETDTGTVVLVVNGAGEECVKQVSGIPKGNDQSAQIQNNVNDAGLQRSVIKAQQEENGLEELRHDSNNMLVKPKFKLSKKSWQITGRDQDELRSDEVANINNGQQSLLESGSGQVLKTSTGQQQYQNYHCPTGKSCSSSSTSHAKLLQPASANKLSTVKLENATDSGMGLGAVEEIAFAAAAAGVATNHAATLSAGNHKGEPEPAALTKLLNGPSIRTFLHSHPHPQPHPHPQAFEWQLLQHLSAEHRLAIVHFYGTFGQRLQVHVQVRPQQTQACIRLSEPPSTSCGSIQVHTFFLTVLAINDGQDDKHAVFLWYLNSDQQEQEQEHDHFQTVIESTGRRVKWFGTAQPLTRSWTEIRAAGQYLTWTDEGQNATTDFDIIVKRK